MLQLNQVSKSMFGNSLLKEVTIQIKEKEKIALVGNNGSGKSTLLKIISGFEAVDRGTVSIAKNKKISYLEQNSIVETEDTVYDYIYNGQKEIKELALTLKELELKLADSNEEELEKVMARYGQVQEQFIERDGYVIEESIKSIATGLRISHLLYQPISELSGGQQTLAKLARCLLENNELLLLDEPTNHLDTEGLNWLENHLKHSKQTVVIVSHDRYFLDQVVDRVLLIHQKEVKSYPGNYTKFKELRQQELIAQEKHFSLQQKEIKQTEDAIRRFRHWGAISDNEKHFKKAKRLESQLASMEKIDKPQESKSISKNQQFQMEKRSGKEVIRIKEVDKAFSSVKLFDQLTLTVFRDERLAIIGGNGTGKTTLIKLILGDEAVDAGDIKIGESVEIGYLSQVIHYSRPEETVLAYFKSHVELFDGDARRILSYFKFFKEDVFKQVGKLSGGEKVRLELACLMNQSINCLILDEPTNHLDIETREWLEAQLLSFNGTILMVSHDRYFVETLATNRFELKNNQSIKG